MKTIGTYLRQAREARSMSIADLEDETKIKKAFLNNLESERWSSLPEYTVVVGFVKNIASALDLNREQAVALLRRDYPPSPVNVSPKQPLPKREFRWGPRATFISAIGVVLLIISGYLLYQYQVFVSPPTLVLYAPIEEQVITTDTFTVRGKTASDATVRVNNQPILLDDEGNFTGDIEIDENLSKVEVKAISRTGRETTIVRNIRVTLKN